METKTYIVALHKDIDYDLFWSEMESPTSGLPHIPDRAVRIVNSRDAFLRICEYALTDDEAERVRNDPRVVGVDLPVEDNPFVKIGIVSTQSGNFNKQSGYIGSLASADYSDTTRINWGLIQHTNVSAYGTSLTTTENYKYVLDGTGVDIIISDTGIQSDHPEFQFLGNTTSRVQYIDWSTYVPALSTMGNSYQDADGHGTQVCGIAAGKTYGWAKNSNIYSINVVGTNPGGFLDVLHAMKLFHTSKTNGRPTVVNMSWATYINQSLFGTGTTQQMTNFLANITGGSYQGNTYSGHTNVASYGILANSSISNDQLSWINGFPYPISTYDVAVDEMTGNGIVVCRAAGNSQYKVDKPAGAGGTGDWDNYITVALTNVYYHRGFSPTSNNAIVVGALDTTTSGFAPLGRLQRAYYSNAGPGVDVYAAGTYIMSAGANTSPGTYFTTSFKTLNDSGTSQASPQVAGMVALYLQAHPTATPAQVKTWVSSNSNTTLLYSHGNSTTYSDRTSLLGGSNGIAVAQLGGVTQIKTGTNSWNYVANVKIKTDATTWSNVKNIYTKTINGWSQTF